MAHSRSLVLPIRIAVALAVLPWIAAPAWAADEARIDDLERKLANSMALIEQLSRRIQQLESGPSAAAALPPGTAAPPAAASTDSEQNARIQRLEQSVQTMSESAARTRDLGVPLHGFADVGWGRGLATAAGRRSGFVLGNLDLYMTPQFGDRVRSIVELVFEYGPDGGGVATDLERLQFGYTFNDALTLWMGRYHTPYGYWNAAFHHGAQIQTALTRPRFVEFEDRGGILPAHGVGLLGSGSVRAGNGRVQYDGYIANGNKIVNRTLDLQPFADDNGNKLVGANVRYAFGGALDGLTLGVHAFRQRVASYDATGTPQSRTNVNMAGGLLVYDTDQWEVIGEYYRFRNRDAFAGTGTHSSSAGFLQAGYRVGPWTPYARAERASLDQSDDYFAAQDSGRSYHAGVLGVRYELNPSAALKLEWNRLSETQVGGALLRGNGARFQVAVRF